MARSRKLFADFVKQGFLPVHRIGYCRWEYQQIAHAFKTLISPHVDPVLQEKVRGREWLRARRRQVKEEQAAMAIRIGTSEHDGTFHSQGRALKVVLDRQPSLAPVEVLTADTASVENANRLHADEIAFGFMAANWIGRAKKGEAPFRNPIDIRMAAPMNAGPLFFIVRADSAVRSVADLRGRRVVLGPEKSGMVQHAHTIFGVLGLAFTEFTPVYLDFEAGADELARGDRRRAAPVPDPQQGDDRAERAMRRPGAALCAGSTREACWARSRSIAAS